MSYSAQRVLRLLAVTLFNRMSLATLMLGIPPHGPPAAMSPQLSMGFGYGGVAVAPVVLESSHPT